MVGFPKPRIFSLVVLITLGLGSLLLENLLGLTTVSRNYWTNELAIEKGCNVTLGIASYNGSLSDSAVDGESVRSFSGLAIVGAFNHQRDVFKNTKDPVNATFKYIESWYESLQQFPSMHGIVLHNMFSPEQTKAWSSHHVNFAKVENHTTSFQQAKRRPINDMRFFVLRDFLKRLYAQRNDTAQGRTLPDYVLFTDSYDVRFLRNPFDYMKQVDSFMGEPQIFVGEEYAYSSRKKIWDEWMNKSSTKCFGKSLPPSSRMINCGLVGGHIDVVLKLLDKLVAKLKSGKPHMVCDQISLHYTLSTHYRDKFISGYPFNSLFNQWEDANNTLAYIAHK
jgi:hypothetical protein